MREKRHKTRNGRYTISLIKNNGKRRSVNWGKRDMLNDKSNRKNKDSKNYKT